MLKGRILAITMLMPATGAYAGTPEFDPQKGFVSDCVIAGPAGSLKRDCCRYALWASDRLTYANPFR